MRILSSLTNRIFLASAALTVLCIGAAIYLVNARVTAAAEDELVRDLKQAGAVVDQQRSTVSALFAVLARTVADLPKLKAAVDTGDPPTVLPIAADYRLNVHADLLLVDDRAGHLLAALGPPGMAPGIVETVASRREAHAGHEARMFLPLTNGLFELVSVPITAGSQPEQIVGTLTLGFLLDDRLAARFKTLTDTEVAFAADGRIVASTLPVGSRAALDRLAAMPPIQRVSAGGEEYLAVRRPLDAPPQPSLFGDDARIRQATTTDAARPSLIVLRSRTERLRLLRPIQAALIATGVVGVLLAIGLSYAIARTITRPLAAITDAMKEMAATGDLTRKLDWRPNRWEDEDAQLLARTFNTLTGSITRFQREAAERERLSALGRLSTVIAHEVRNPLMIIKASLRLLMSASATRDEVREAAADIDGEVVRLNRLVNDVLDFARPLQFDLASADANDLCRASVAAAATGFPGVSFQLALDSSVGPIITDADRLRSALVNIVANACDAVVARHSEAAAPVDGAAGHAHSPVLPDVQLSTYARAARFEIVVVDRGAGIEAAELPRVFDPYFTTKRTGTGLGLAISRNIIEGLGGTLRITSERGKGTEVRIELPVNGAGEQP